LAFKAGGWWLVMIGMRSGGRSAAWQMWKAVSAVGWRARTTAELALCSAIRSGRDGQGIGCAVHNRILLVSR